jgi:hypothetical protein
MEEAEPKGGLDRSRAEITFDPIEDRLQPDELPRGVKVEQGVDQTGATLDDGKPLREPRPYGGVLVGDRARSGEIRSIEAGASLFAAA